MQDKPLVSVVMAVYNGEKCISRAIDSILNQTFEDFEFIIINDGSIDKTEKILKEYKEKDNRIKIIKNPTNIGLTKSLNIGIKKSKGKYIARQDADDESLPERLEKQVEFLEKHKEIVLLGTNQYEINTKGDIRIGKYFDPIVINKIVFFINPFPHTSALFRKDIFINIGLYDESFTTSQDFEAWMRMAKVGEIAMLKEPLVKRYTGQKNSITRKKRFIQCINGARARFRHPKYGYFKALYFTIYQFITAYLPDWVINLKRKLFK